MSGLHRYVQRQFDMGNINDNRYLYTDVTTDMVQNSHPAQNIVSFVNMSSPENQPELKLYGNIETKTQ